jgi:hypothetical protein
MDFQFWLIVAIAVISLLGRLGKKKETNVPDPKPNNPRRYKEVSRPAEVNRPVVTEKPRQMSFEELLREITEAKQPKPSYAPPTPQRQPVSEVVDYDEEIGEEEQDLEVIEDEIPREQEFRNKRNSEYQEAKSQAFGRVSLEESMSLKDTNIQFGKFKSFEERKKKNLLDYYTRDLKGREGLKKAFVLTEILNRKF